MVAGNASDSPAEDKRFICEPESLADLQLGLVVWEQATVSFVNTVERVVVYDKKLSVA